MTAWGVILAGGLATRMGGGDKCLLPVGGQPILSQVIARLRPQVEGLILSANGDPARFAAFGLPVVADDPQEFAGPLAGVLAGMEAARARGASHIVTAAGDTPFLPHDLADRLAEAARRAGEPLACAATRGDRRERRPGNCRENGDLRDHPAFGLWPVALAADLRTALAGGARRVIAWMDAQGCARAAFDGGAADPFLNVNTPGDLAAADARARAEGAEGAKGAEAGRP